MSTTPEATTAPPPVPAPSPAPAMRPAWHPAPPPRLTRRDLLWMAGIFLLALALRLVYVQQLRANSPDFDHPGLDAEIHDEWARAIAEGKHYWDGPYFRAPLYPWLLGFVYKTFGHGYVLPRILQALLGSLSCALIFLLGRDVFTRAAGAIAGLLAATYWVFLFFDAELLLPVLLVFLDVLGLWLVWRAAAHDRLALWGAAGLVLGLSAITRPNILVYFPFVLAWIVMLHWRRWDAVLTRGAAFVIACALPILPVTVRNYSVGGDLVLISSQGGVNFYIGNNPESDGTTAVVPGTPPSWWGGYYATVGRAEADRGRKLKPSEVSQYYFDKSFEWISAQPARAFNLTLAKTVMFWDRFEASNNKGIYFFSRTFTPIVRLLPIHFGIVAPLGLLGVAIALRRPARYFPLWSFIFVYAASIIAFFITERYRIPVIPLLMIFGGYAIVWGVDAWRADRRGALFAALVALALLYHLVNSPSKGREEPAFDSYVRIGSIYAEKRDSEKALEWHRRAVEAKPTDASAHFLMAIDLGHLGRLDEAAEHSAIAFDLTPANYDACATHCDILVRLGRHADALAVVRKGVESAPDDARLLTKAALTILSCPDAALRDVPEATRLAQRACELTKFLRAEPLIALAEAFNQSNQPAAAHRTAQAALQRASENRQTPYVIEMQKFLQSLEAQHAASQPATQPTTAPAAPPVAPSPPVSPPPPAAPPDTQPVSPRDE